MTLPGHVAFQESSNKSSVSGSPTPECMVDVIAALSLGG